MNEIIEEIRIKVEDGKLTVTGVGVEPEDDKYELQATRMCELMAWGIGQVLGHTFDEDKAVKLAAGMSYAILLRLSEVLDQREAGYEAN